MLGCQIEVDTIQGKRKINIPGGVSQDTKIKLPGEGVTKLAPNQNQKGDHYVVLKINIPKNISKEQR